MKPGEKILAIIFFAFASLAVYLSYCISGFKSMSSPGSFPMIVSFVLLGSSFFILRDAYTKEAKKSLEENNKSVIPSSVIKMLFSRFIVIFILGSFIYLFLIIKISFIYASLLYVWFVGVYFKSKRKVPD